ncbi:MAG: hypothetical protein Q8L54_11985 [Devosia sp.]|nr:hypothetical protein [Devosia sp.]
MKTMFSHLLVLLTALSLTAGGLLASAGSASAVQFSGAWTQATTVEAEPTLVSEHGTDEIVAAAVQCRQNGCAADCSVYCVSAMGSGCCPPCAVFCEGPVLPEVDSALLLAGVPTTAALSGIDPQAGKRPPRILA